MNGHFELWIHSWLTEQDPTKKSKMKSDYLIQTEARMQKLNSHSVAHLPLKAIQLGKMILGQFAFYAVFWGYFDALKLQLNPWFSGNK